MSSTATAKSVKEDISRATGYARRMEAVKALRCAGRAFDGFAGSSRIMGRAKIELEILLGDMLRELELVPEIKGLLRGSFVFKRGSEQQFALALAAVAMRVEHLRQADEEKALDDRLARIATAFDKARQALRESSLPMARRVLSSVCEHNPLEPNIWTNAAKVLAEAGLHADAIPFAEKALEINPKDAVACGLAVEACRSIGELPKAESLLRAALRSFGAHPRTFVSLAKVLYQMGKWDQAYDAARGAFDRDPSLDEAREILELTEQRVMG